MKAVVCIGEWLVDVLPDAEVPGGAPANAALHAAQLGVPAFLVSRVGSDSRGRRLREVLGAAGVDLSAVQTDLFHATGTVRVRPRAGGEVDYEIETASAWDFLEVSEEAMAVAGAAGVVVFGTLAQRGSASRSALRVLVASAPPDARRLLDLNLREPWYDEEVLRWSLQQATILKMNLAEWDVVAATLGLPDRHGDGLPALAREGRWESIVVTGGAEGAWIWSEGVLTHEPAVPVPACDPVGAGDGLTAGLAAGLVAGRSLREAVALGMRVAAWIVAQRGATPRLPPGLQDCLRED